MPETIVTIPLGNVSLPARTINPPPPIPVPDQAQEGQISDHKKPVKQSFRVGEMATICRVTPRTVTKWINSGILQGWRVLGSNRRCDRSTLLAFTQKNHPGAYARRDDWDTELRKAAAERRKMRKDCKQIPKGEERTSAGITLEEPTTQDASVLSILVLLGSNSAPTQELGERATTLLNHQNYRPGAIRSIDNSFKAGLSVADSADAGLAIMVPAGSTLPSYLKTWLLSHPSNPHRLDISLLSSLETASTVDRLLLIALPAGEPTLAPMAYDRLNQRLRGLKQYARVLEMA